MNIGYETVTCSICGKSFEALVIDRHISQPIICDHCFDEILNEIFDKESKEK